MYRIYLNYSYSQKNILKKYSYFHVNLFNNHLFRTLKVEVDFYVGVWKCIALMILWSVLALGLSLRFRRIDTRSDVSIRELWNAVYARNCLGELLTWRDEDQPFCDLSGSSLMFAQTSLNKTRLFGWCIRTDYERQSSSYQDHDIYVEHFLSE